MSGGNPRDPIDAAYEAFRSISKIYARLASIFLEACRCYADGAVRKLSDILQATITRGEQASQLVSSWGPRAALIYYAAHGARQLEKKGDRGLARELVSAVMCGHMCTSVVAVRNCNDLVKAIDDTSMSYLALLAGIDRVLGLWGLYGEMYDGYPGCTSAMLLRIVGAASNSRLERQRLRLIDVLVTLARLLRATYTPLYERLEAASRSRHAKGEACNALREVHDTLRKIAGEDA